MTAEPNVPADRIDWLLGGLTAGLGTAETILLAQPHIGDSISLIAVVHLAVTLISSVLTRLVPHRLQQSALWPLMPVVVLILGPVGAFGLSLAIGVQGVSVAKTDRFVDWYESLFPTSVDPGERLYEDLAFRGYRFSPKPDVVPLIDIARYGQVQVKQRLVVTVTERYVPAFAAFLSASLSDAEPAIRVQAATAMAKLEHRFSDSRRRLEDALPSGRGETASELATLLVTFADSGLIDELRARELRAEARRYGELAIASHGETLSALLATARACLSQGDHQDAIRLLKPAIRSLAEDEEASLVYSTALFKGGWFGELHRFAQSLADRPIRSIELRRIAATWATVPT